MFLLLVLIVALLSVVALSNASIPSANAQNPPISSNCGTHDFRLRDGSGAGGMIVTTTFVTIPAGSTIKRLYYDVNWWNWSAKMAGTEPSEGSIHDTFEPFEALPAAQRMFIVPTDPGLVTAVMSGYVEVRLASGALLSCWIIPSGDSVYISGINQFPENQLPLPLTADADGNDLTDSTVCGNICDKKKDQLAEKDMAKRNRKVCDVLDTSLTRPQPFKACKQSGNRAVYDDHGSKYADEWYKANRNGWECPTDPTNKPDGYSGSYCPQKGYNHPNLTPTPNAIPTAAAPQPTPDIHDCTISATTVIVCEVGSGEVHVLQAQPYLLITSPTPTLAPTLTPVPTPTQIATTLSHNAPGGVSPNHNVTVSWSGVVGATSIDKIELWRQGGYLASPPVWKYTDSCTQTHGSNAVASGSCTVLIPSSIAHDHYVFVFRDGDDIVTVTSPDLWIEDNCVRNPGNCSE